MKFGSREICNVVFKAKSPIILGSKTFKKHEPVIYFDSAKASDISGTATSVYAQGGRGNPKLITWEGEKNVTFSFTDALISPEGIAILTGADLFEKRIFQKHVVFNVIASAGEGESAPAVLDLSEEVEEAGGEGATITVPNETKGITLFVYNYKDNTIGAPVMTPTIDKNVVSATNLVVGDNYLVDAYIQMTGTELEILPEKFSDYFYIEADTLFRRESDGVDKAAQFVIPKGKVQSAFTLTMANTGDPSTFEFIIDAMSDYVKGSAKKTLFTLDIAD